MRLDASRLPRGRPGFDSRLMQLLIHFLAYNDTSSDDLELEKAKQTFLIRLVIRL